MMVSVQCNCLNDTFSTVLFLSYVLFHYDHNTNQLKAPPGRRDKSKYTDHLSAEMKPQRKRLNYFPKLNSVVKYANTGSKYSNPDTAGLNKINLYSLLPLVSSFHYRH